MKRQKKACITLALLVYLVILLREWKNGKNDLFSGLFRRMKIQNKENKDAQIYKH